jgi:peptidoglycan-associated lipoprotein
MYFKSMGLKSLSLAAVVALAAACSSDPETSAASSGQGGAQQGTTTTTTTQPSGTAMPAPGSQADLVASVGDRVFYDFDRYELKPEARNTVERWAGWLKKYPQVTAKIEGHADERGTREYNLGLGERRATSARNYLIALGVNRDRLTTISYGKERPVCTASNEACWSQNRRAVLMVGGASS